MWEVSTVERKYAVPPTRSTVSEIGGSRGDDLHAWSIYRQNLNSDFADSALGSSKSPLPYGNFQLRQSTVESILSQARSHGANGSSELLDNNNIHTYLRFGLPRVLSPTRHLREGSSGYDSSDDGASLRHRRTRSDPDFRSHIIRQTEQAELAETSFYEKRPQQRSSSEANLLDNNIYSTASGDVYHHHHHHRAGGKRTRHHGGGASSHRAESRQMMSSSQANKYEMHHEKRSRHTEGNSRITSDSHSKYRDADSHSRYRDADSHSKYRDTDSHSKYRDVDSHSKYRDTDSHSKYRDTDTQSKYRDADNYSRYAESHSRYADSHAGAGGYINSGYSEVHYRPGTSIYGVESAPLLNDKYFPKDTVYSLQTTSRNLGSVSEDYDLNSARHPHLQIVNLTYIMDNRSNFSKFMGVSRRTETVLEGITLEARGGDLLAIMSTKEFEGKTLLDILSNRHKQWRCTMKGDILVNGLYVKPGGLENRVAYAIQDVNFNPNMSLKQTLLFVSLLKKPGQKARRFDIKGRIEALIDDLQLRPVAQTRIKNLTDSEKRRLNVACQLLLDTDIVLLDQPTKNMDIFDTFFLVEFLRQWAARGRIVIMTIHPPTYEIFAMFTKVALLSTGRLMFFGKRKDMLPYFSAIDYPCPAYKNPSDYYLDLVTFDNLSPEAMLESSQRLEQLADFFRRRQDAVSDPGPPGIPPPVIHRSNLFVQIFVLWIRALIYMFPYNVLAAVHEIFLGLLMSILVGAIFIDLRRVGSPVNDTFGFFFVMTSVALWPNLLLLISRVWSTKNWINRDLKDKLYWRGSYIIAKILYNFPVAILSIFAYVIPAYWMANLRHDKYGVFGMYVAVMIIFLLAMRMMVFSLAYAFGSRYVAALISGVILTFCSTTSGYSVHFVNLWEVFEWFRWVSPNRWAVQQLSIQEFENQRFIDCSRFGKIDGDRIIPTSPCGLRNGTEALNFMWMNGDWYQLYMAFIIPGAFGLFFLILAVVFFIFCNQKQKTSHD